jgi:hypothetical protein
MFTKFNARAFLEADRHGAATTERQPTLATLAGLAKGKPDSENEEGNATTPTLGIERREGVTANFANLAKARRRVEPLPANWSEVEQERAAIIEYDGGAPRAWAEALARLDPAKPPCDIPPDRWVRFIDDCGRFLDAWAHYTLALGWTPLDLFGCDRERPWERIDQQGLLWLINGNSLVALSAESAIVEILPDRRETYRRRALEPGRVVLTWDLQR